MLGWDRAASFMVRAGSTNAIGLNKAKVVYATNKPPGFACIFKISWAAQNQKIAFCEDMHFTKRGMMQLVRNSGTNSFLSAWFLYFTLTLKLQAAFLQDKP